LALDPEHRRQSMRRSLVTARGQLEIGSCSDPAPESDEVVVRVEACGICGTDRNIFTGTYPMTFPVTLGHEYAGTVVEVGSDVRGLRVGDRVAVDPNVVCGTCASCRRGRVNLCTGLTPLGIVRPGGFAELSAVPERNAHLIPDTMTAEAGAMVEPLACAIQGIRLAEVQLGDVGVVLGGGPMGAMLAQLLRLRGAGCVIVSEPNPVRRALALRLGADVGVDPGEGLRDAVMSRTSGEGADVVFEVAGLSSAASAAVTLTRRGGTLVWFGVCPRGESIPVEPFHVYEAELTIRGSFLNPFTHATAVSLVASGRVDVDALVTDRLPLDRLGEALDSANFPASMKIVVMPGAPT
jgi:L-iditol 2-dehydrogenase